MATSLCSLALLLSVNATGGLFDFALSRPNFTDDGIGFGNGYRNGNPDGYGWRDYSYSLPLGANRTPDYFFPRFHAVPPDQLYFPTYFNPYITRGQRFVPYVNCGGAHPAGGSPIAPASLPVNPYNDTLGSSPLRPEPRFGGRVEASPINPGTSGLRP